MSVRVIGGDAKGRLLKSPTGQQTRPTSNLVRSAIFSMLEPYLDAARVLDLFSGTGALGVEALSRGADWVDFFESDARQCSAIKENLKSLDYSAYGQVHRARAERAATMVAGPYDVILLDPPYSYDQLERLLEGIGESALSQPGCIVAVEHSHRQDLPLEVDGLRLIKQRRYGETMVTVYQQGGE
jgi:16S rRNA (guanine966-N2)-methyltransferase